MTGIFAILGPGALGLSTAQWAAECGLQVRLLGRDLDHARQGLQEVEQRWGVAMQKGALSPQAHEKARSRLQAAPFSLEAMESVSTLLEALPEDPGQKTLALAMAAGWGGTDLLLLSGTSALPISDLAEAAGIQKRLLGFHLFVPVPRMAVVEVAVPSGTPPSLVDQGRALGLALRKRVVVVQDQPGFAAARMALVQGLEAMRLLEAGAATTEDLDALMTLGYGHPVGPLELSDRIGLDLRLSIAEGLFRASRNPRFEPPTLLREKVAQGETGRKAGRGFYTWDPDGRRL
ncbi:3-hydroxyacyl-CoA dehydrogenase family protein [Geothrix fuzhouensis]|uniref:3-hydroxyacyl-CoA dehydrogenase family protein n=1 Tax=Geothrix fuzhouensis TaxID=2966451 RepID=UPI00214858C8|nr:3-hydroxyacyl-CoA dehydrogenase family protein [Geothrix fuzhouensis]